MSFAAIPYRALETKPSGNVCEKFMNLLSVYFFYLDRVKKQEGMTAFVPPPNPPPRRHSCHRLINARWEEHSEMYPHNYFSSGVHCVHCIFLFISTFTLLTFNTNTVLFLFYVMTLLCSRKKYLRSRVLKILVYLRFFSAAESILVAASSKAVYCINYVSEQQRHQGCFEPLLYNAFESHTPV